MEGSGKGYGLGDHARGRSVRVRVRAITHVVVPGVGPEKHHRDARGRALLGVVDAFGGRRVKVRVRAGLGIGLGL